MIWKGQAQLFDGETSKPQLIEISLEPEGLEIHSAKASHRLGAIEAGGNTSPGRYTGYYRRKEVAWLEVREDGFIRLELPAHPGLLLEIHSPEARLFIRQHGMDRKHWLPDLNWGAKSLLLLASLALFIAWFFVFGLDGFSRLIVQYIPPSLDRELGDRIPDLHAGADSGAPSNACLELKHALDKSVKLIQSLDAPGLDSVRIEVAPDTAMVNAFAFPGGRIVVYAGMLRMLDSQQEWFALLAHEAGHVSLRHGMRSLVRTGMLTLTASLILGDAAGLSAFIVDNAQRLATLKYSRADEEEADGFAADHLQAAGFSTEGLARLFEKLEKAQEQPEWSAFLSTHPVPSERVAAAKAKAKSPANTKTGINKKASTDFLTQAEWKALQSGCGSN